MVIGHLYNLQRDLPDEGPPGTTRSSYHVTALLCVPHAALHVPGTVFLTGDSPFSIPFTVSAQPPGPSAIWWHQFGLYS